MNNTDLVVMLGNLSHSIPAINYFLGGFSYILGVTFVVVSFTKLKESIEESGGQHTKLIVPTAYFLAGCGLFFLPSMIDLFSTTLFGTGYNILEYSPANRYDVYGSVTMLIQMAGFIWFMRGCVLLAHASQPEQGQEGSKGHGPKGFLFIVASLFAVNIHATGNMLNHVMSQLILFAGHLTS